MTRIKNIGNLKDNTHRRITLRVPNVFFGGFRGIQAGCAPFRGIRNVQSCAIALVVAQLFSSVFNSVSAHTSNLIRVPLMRQSTDYTCGVAALQALLAYYGQDVREDVLSKALSADQKNGTRYKHIAKYAKQHGLSVNIQRGMSLEQLKQSIQSGHPVLCLIQAWPDKKTNFANDWNDGHYVIAVGFDDKKFVFMDPSTAGHYAYIPIAEFEQRWHDIDGKEKLTHFGMSFWKAGNHFDPEQLERLN